MPENRIYSTFELTIMSNERNKRKVKIFADKTNKHLVYINIVDLRTFDEKVSELNFQVKEFIWFINQLCYHGNQRGKYLSPDNEIFYETDNVIWNNVIIHMYTDGKRRLVSLSAKEVQTLSSRKADLSKHAHWLKKSIKSSDLKLRSRHINKTVEELDDQMDLDNEPQCYDICC